MVMCDGFRYGHYQARLRHIRYGAHNLNVNGAFDEITFDSGASYTYFVPQLYGAVLSAVSFYWHYIFINILQVKPYTGPNYIGVHGVLFMVTSPAF